jgi:1-deoxy-D-xylulose-5-phosphate reductoisomerase
MKSLSILGSTGSIGVSTLDVVRRFPEKFEVRCLAAGRNLKLLAEQVRQFHPECVGIEREEDVPKLKQLLNGIHVEVLCGVEGMKAVATAPGVDLVLSAIVGGTGLVPTLAAIRAEKEVALATKETLVMAGELMMHEARLREVRIIPVDSEHSAIYQCLQGQRKEDLSRIILTASGGPFLSTPLEDFELVTREEALHHPNWVMGSKITIDSATLMNKGLEVIEAMWLFGIQPNQVDVVIHPQSIIHSMVEMQDGSVLAQMGVPDMRGPIVFALSCPERLPMDLPRLDFPQLARLTFLEVEEERFQAVRLARSALDAGGTMPVVLNAANEVAVQAFLEDRIRFCQIVRVIEETLANHESRESQTLEAILEVDAWARVNANQIVRRFQ